MNAILTSLIRLAQRTGLFTEEEATAAYNGLWLKLAYALAACVIAFLLNVAFGMKLPSLLFALVFAVVAFYTWAKPLHVLGAASTGLAAKIVTHESLATEVKEVLGVYLRLLQWVLVVGGVFLLTTGTFSFKGDPEASLRLLIALGVVGIFIWMWPDVFVGTRGRRFFFASALLIAIFSFVSIIPGPVWTKYAGWDPATVRPTRTEEGLYRLERARQKVADADRAKELNRIAEKVEDHVALTQAEELFISATRQSQLKKKASSSQETGTEIPLVSLPRELWPTLELPPGGEKRIAVPPGMRTRVIGEQISLRLEYQDGHQCMIPAETCDAGPQKAVYVENKSQDQNIAAYAFYQ